MNTQELQVYREEFAAFVAIADNTPRIQLSGTTEERKEQLLKELIKASDKYGRKQPTKTRIRKARD
ncbi:TPA: hypothetical protein ACN33C_001899 [Vibrio parahaemolyticus]